MLTGNIHRMEQQKKWAIRGLLLVDVDKGHESMSLL